LVVVELLIPQDAPLVQHIPVVLAFVVEEVVALQPLVVLLVGLVELTYYVIRP
jgi:hypothetical protein